MVIENMLWVGDMIMVQKKTHDSVENKYGGGEGGVSISR